MATIHAKSPFIGTPPTGDNAKKMVAAANERNAAQKDAIPAAFFPYAAVGRKEERNEPALVSEFYRLKGRGLVAAEEQLVLPGVGF
ncbi:MAG: hypothetical protein WC263_03310 [Candidatus Micrarchaeia archaeon]|jgi:hypothetical protein